MMDCKKALTEANGDIAEAEAALKKKGIATAAKKSGRIAAEGAIGAYIHNGSQLGVLIEVNCETDFVARGPIFKELVENLAMQVSADVPCALFYLCCIMGWKIFLQNWATSPSYLDGKTKALFQDYMLSFNISSCAWRNYFQYQA